MLTTTLEMLHQHGACRDRYRYLCKALGGARAYGRKKPITLLRILETNGLEDTLWALRTVAAGQEEERDWVAMAFADRCVLETCGHKLNQDKLRNLHKTMLFMGYTPWQVAGSAVPTARRLHVKHSPMSEWVATGWTELDVEQAGILRELLETPWHAVKGEMVHG